MIQESESPIHNPLSIYSWFFVILRGYFKDATLLVGLSGVM